MIWIFWKTWKLASLSDIEVQVIERCRSLVRKPNPTQLIHKRETDKQHHDLFIYSFFNQGVCQMTTSITTTDLQDGPVYNSSSKYWKKRTFIREHLYNTTE